MEKDAQRLATYLEDRVGDSLRGVGYHTLDSFDVAYIREDITSMYPPDRVERFVDVSRTIGTNLDRLEEMGHPRASMHRLEEGLLIQFYRGENRVVFAVVDPDVGRNFNRFVDECLAALD